MKPMVLNCSDLSIETILPPDAKSAIADFLEASEIFEGAQDIEIVSKRENLDFHNIARIYTVRYENLLAQNHVFPGLEGVSKILERTLDKRGIGWSIICDGKKIIMFTDGNMKFVSYVIPEIL